MAFKLRSPLHKEEPKLPVANDGSNEFKNYQAGLKKTYMSSKDSGVGAYPDPQTGERTFYDKKHQSYDMKKGVTNKTGSFQDGKYIMNKPKPAATKPKSPYPAKQGGSPMNNVFTKIKKSYIKSNPSWQRTFGYDSEGNKIGESGMPKTSGPKKLSPGGGVKKPNITNEGYKIPGTKSNDRPAYERPGTGSTEVNKPKTVKPSSNTNTSTNPTKTTTSSNTKPIKSSDSDKGGYKPNMTSAEFFGKDYSKELRNSIAPMPKFERTVTNARSSDHNIIGSKPMSKRDRIIRKQNIKTEKKRERVGNQIERIKGRQARKGINIAKKDLKRSDEYVNKGYSSIVDAKPNKTSSSSSSGFQDLSKVGGSKNTQSKSTTTQSKPTTTQKKTTTGTSSTKGIRPNITVQSPSIIDDSRIKKGAKEAKDGRINERVSESTYQSATGFAKLSKKAGPSGGMQRGMPKSSTSITKPASGPRAKNIKVKSGPSEREKFIMNAYKNI